MEDLLHKYINNKLTPEELILFRDELKAISDREIEAQMELDWLIPEGKAEDVPDTYINQMRERLHVELRPPKKQPVFMRMLRVAIILLIPLLMATTFYFYYSSQVVASHDMVVSAGKGERVSIVLPDGTKVRINAMSTLSYNPVRFNKKDRTIRFEGEAFFDVSRDENAPFRISTFGMDLNVLGTVFNLQAREYEKNIEVSLLSGHVMLWSPISRKEQELFKNEKAILCKGTGEFTVTKIEGQKSIPWLSDEMVFKNKPLEEVICTIEANFDVKFNFIGRDLVGSDRFTGTLPTRDLNQVLEILSRSCGFRCEVSGSVVNVSPIYPALK